MAGLFQQLFVSHVSQYSSSLFTSMSTTALLARPPEQLCIKVCGMKFAENIAAVANLEPDYMGFIFHEKSARYVADTLDSRQLRSLPAKLCKVGVFVDPTTTEVLRQMCAFQLDYAQLHGHESAAQCAELQRAGVKIIKAFSVADELDQAALLPHLPHCDYFLFDTKGPLPGGNGTPFNWQALSGYALPVPYFLSGGLALSHAAVLHSLRLPGLYGVDLNSCFEITPGEKDVELLRQMFQTLRS